MNNLVVLVQPTDKKSIEDYGSQEKFLESVSYLLGRQAYSGEFFGQSALMSVFYVSYCGN